ncbi:MAG: anthranilate synthase component I family protein [Crenarchaeota archaeon]|nr:MAG: anthranilate synthase component I family protein [Thermoproteota archaeon]RDJ34220.1 MAG: anthranilate synthase component I family protein [Thermoproteota archaeon]RDJ36666.1 MAG: anthranilate synthase component I family protein [Thermoproteota archaeon]RDJ37802.1 MAG: anthranilate synthase component I family protein [Thermoproteota archaeon]
MNTFGKAKPTVIPLELSENQFELYKKISKNYSHTFLFESLTGPEELAETSIIGFEPEFVIKGYKNKIEVYQDNKLTKTIQTDDPFKEIKKLIKKTDDKSYRYFGGAVGFVNYDAIRLVENIPIKNKSDEVLMEFGIYHDGIFFDNKKNKPYYFYYDTNRYPELIKSQVQDSFEISEFTPNISKDTFESMVDKAKRYVHDGDIFQVVLSRRFDFTAKGNFLKVYDVLRKINPSPYMYHMKMNEKIIIGASPEMLIRVTDDIVETFPIAGTRKITDDEEKNKSLEVELLNDEKELAEHTMLVDLGRNDIGRVCKFGSVIVKELMKIKRFSHVQHIVSHVVGTLNQKFDMFDAFKAVFPAGTVSGAPKVRAMEIIEELEPQSRGPYAGAVGYFSCNGCCDFAIAIRSIFFDGKNGFVQSGAGIVSDSIPENEFKETEHKANAMLTALKEATK